MSILDNSFIFDGRKAVSTKGLSDDLLTNLFGGVAGISSDPYKASAWLYAVIIKRAAATRSIPRILKSKSGDPIKERDLPFKIDLGGLLYQSSIALDRRGAAYWGKVRGSTGKLARVRWLDPDTITPIYSTTGAGLLRFDRNIGGTPKKIKYDGDTDSSPDLGFVWRLGLNEAGPAVAPAVIAKRPAKILAGIDKLVDDLFERGAMQQLWITADFNPGKREKEELLAKIKRTLFKGLDSAFGVEIFSSRLHIDKIGTDPKDLELKHLDESNQIDICAVLETPRLIINPDAAANRAVLDRVWSSWLEWSIVPNTQRIVDALNHHILEAAGYILELNPGALTLLQEEERQRMQAWSLFVSQGGDPETGAAILGFTVPEGMPLMAGKPTISVQRPSITPEPEERDDKAIELTGEASTAHLRPFTPSNKRQSNWAIKRSTLNSGNIIPK